MPKRSPASSVIEHRAEYLQICAALGIFSIGVLVYLFDRSGADFFFVPVWWRFADGTPDVFGVLGQSLPSFAHTFCFCLLISALLVPWRISPLAICVGWGAVEAVLELAQIGPAADRILVLLPGGLGDWPILANVPVYFSHGRFDPLDLIFISMGCAAAWLIIVFTNCVGGPRSC